MPKKSTNRPGKSAGGAKRTNTGRDSENAAKGPIIRSLPQSMSGEPVHPVEKKSLLKRGLLVLIIILVAAFTYLTCKARRAVLSETGTVKIEGLKSGVTISRDELGVPLIKADNEYDAFFGAGYAAATDRLWQMYAAKLAVTGRLSELAGSKMLPVDVYMRTVGIKRNVDRAIEKLTDKYRAPLTAYAAGVNAFLKANKNLPIEFTLTGYEPEPWTINDCGYVFGALSFGLALNINEEIFFLDAAKKFGPEKAAWLVPTYHDEPIPFAEAQKIDKKLALDLSPQAEQLHSVMEDLEKIYRVGLPASNNWVIAGSKTKGGKAILANDTHLPVTIPAIWTMMSIDSPTYKAAGVTIAGQPYIQLGYNGSIAWGATMVEADCQDLFIETLKSENNQTLFLRSDNTWSPVREKTEHFKVRFGRDRDIKIRFTGNGPLVSDALNQLGEKQLIPLVPVGTKTARHLAMRWSLQDGDNAGVGIYEMGQAKTMAEFRRATSRIQSIYLNLAYTDGTNIAWQTTGKIPIRSKGTGQLPSVAADGYHWNGFLPFDAQPHRENPERGFLATANERTVARDDKRKISSVYYSPERAERIAELLSGRDDWTGDTTKQMQLDLYSRMSAKTLLTFKAMEADLNAAIARLPEKKQKRVRAAQAMLAKFNNTMTKDSGGAALISAFYYKFTRNVFGDELEIGSTLWKGFVDTNLRSYNAPQDHILGREESPYFDDIRTKEKETKADMIALSLADAYEFCEDEMGAPEKWKWGKLHKIYWRSEITKDLGIASWYFNHGPATHEGDSHTINVGHYAWGETFDTFALPAMRLVVDFNNPEPAELIVHTGVSGLPSSAHYDDQVKYYLEGRNNSLPLGDAAQKKQYIKILRLER